ncbi:MAG: hypothetical protein SVZ03_00815 [Spirochaetota bacterium]|nr:hypothetical protein [Spirochaetota bacterium]
MIKTMTIVTVIIIIYSNPLKAGDNRIGVGFLIGSFSGLTGKFFIDEGNSIDVGIGDPSDEGYYIYGDYLSHFSEIFPINRLLNYLGVGVGFHHFKKDHKWKLDEEENRLELRIPFGMEYLTPKIPLGIFIELVPTLRFIHDIDFNLRGGLGMRYYF